MTRDGEASRRAEGAACGAGSTPIACAKVGRRACPVELDRGYRDGIVRRFEAFAGRAAVLDGDGRSFEEIAAGRAAAAACGHDGGGLRGGA